MKTSFRIPIGVHILY